MKTLIPLLALLALSAGPLLTGCAENPVTGRPELSLISEQEEIALGREAAPQFEAEFGGLVPDATLQSYVNGVGQQVAAASDRPNLPYEFGLLNSDMPNAFALPGGKIYITRGLFLAMDNEAELAAVLGHEIGHVAARHNVQALQRQLGVNVLAQLAAQALGGDRGQVAAMAVQVVGGMRNLQYSRGAEYQADDVGIQYMERAGYNPWGMVALLQTLSDMQQRQPGRFEEMFSTHPLPDERIERARDTVRRSYPGARPGGVSEPTPQFRGLQQRLGG